MYHECPKILAVDIHMLNPYIANMLDENDQ